MVTALILSGGTGTCLGADIPKQYIEVNNRPIISYCFEMLALSGYIIRQWKFCKGFELMHNKTEDYVKIMVEL